MEFHYPKASFVTSGLPCPQRTSRTRSQSRELRTLGHFYRALFQSEVMDVEGPEELRQVFALMDRDYDLELSFEELKMALRALGVVATETQFDDVRRDLESTTGSSNVSYSGFLSVLAKMEYQDFLKADEKDIRQSTEHALRYLDPQGNYVPLILCSVVFIAFTEFK